MKVLRKIETKIAILTRVTELKTAVLILNDVTYK